MRVNGDQIEDVAVRIPLTAGWNMIGDPFPFAVDWNGCQVEYQGQTKPLSEAVDAGWISGTLYTYEPGGYTWVNAPAGQLKPWEGYWVKAKVNCWLLVPPVPSGVIGLGERRSEDGMALEERGRATAKEWRLRLSVSAGTESEDRYNFIGVSESARDGADSRDVEEPPAPGAGVVSLYLVEGGRRLAQDVRSASSGGPQVWDVEVLLPGARQQVTLSWPDLSALPRGMEAYLEDEATGRRVAMRTCTAYSFNSGEGGVRRFRITVQPRSGSSLAITELSVMRTRGVPSVRVNISRDAMLRVVVLDPASGRRQTLVGEHAGRAGMNVISTGRSDGLGAGMYLIEIYRHGKRRRDGACRPAAGHRALKGVRPGRYAAPPRVSCGWSRHRWRAAHGEGDCESTWPKRGWRRWRQRRFPDGHDGPGARRRRRIRCLRTRRRSFCKTMHPSGLWGEWNARRGCSRRARYQLHRPLGN